MKSLGFAVAACLTLAAPSAFAQSQPQATPSLEGTSLTVNAQGFALAEPDMATLVLGVVTEDVTATGALTQNAERMNRLVATLRTARVAERDIQTSRISVGPRYADRPYRIAGYSASNSVNVRVRNLDHIGRLIDTAAAAGGNTVERITFAHADPTPHLDSARRSAALEARRRADLFAQAFGMRVVRVKSVMEQGYYGSDEIVVTGSRVSGSEPTPILPGEIASRVSLAVVFELR